MQYLAANKNKLRRTLFNTLMGKNIPNILLSQTRLWSDLYVM